MTRNHRSRRLLGLALLLPLVAFGACGGDDDNAKASGSGGATTTAGDDMSSTTMASGGGDDAAASGDAVKIADFAFQPSTLKVAAGTKVTFTNDDEYAHTATANDGSFDSKSLDKGDTYEFTFDKPGTYAYKCSIHNSMMGKVVVE